MAWRIETWLKEVFPGENQIYFEYRDLSPRELAIVAAAVLDIALAELLSKRLFDVPKEYEDFLGLSGDGRAPAGTFGARIQLALLLGVITKQDTDIFRKVKHIRNEFSHRVKVDFTSPAVKKDVKCLCQLFRSRLAELLIPVVGVVSKADELRNDLDITSETGADVLIAVLIIYQMYFRCLMPHINRVLEIHVPKLIKHKRNT